MIRSNKLSSWGVVLTISATLILAACGSGPGGAQAGSDGVASLGTGATAETTGGNDSGGLEAPTDDNEAFLLYDKCMAEKGFPTDMATSADEGAVSSDGGGDDDEGGDDPVEGREGGGDGPSQKLTVGGLEIEGDDVERFQKADKACFGHLANIQTGAPEYTPEQKAALADAEVKVQKCLQEKGIDMKVDLTGGEGVGFEQESDGDGSGTPPDPEKINEAVEECSKVFDEYPELDDAPLLPGRES